MTGKKPVDERQPQQSIYEIRIHGHLDARWTDWFDGLTITLEANGDTLLTGLLVDQAALYGLLKKVRDLGLPLVSVNRVEPGPTAAFPHRGSPAANQEDPPGVKP